MKGVKALLALAVCAACISFASASTLHYIVCIWVAPLAFDCRDDFGPHCLRLPRALPLNARLTYVLCR